MGLFDKNSWFTKFVEGIPVVGYIPSAVHALAGNTDEARRAAAKSTSSALVTVGGIGGFIVGGPAGAMAGGAAGGAAGSAVEGAIATTVSDDVKKDMISLKGKDILIGTAFGGLTGAFSGISTTIGKEVGLSTAKGFVVGKALDGSFVALPKSLIDSGKPIPKDQTGLSEEQKNDAAKYVKDVVSQAKNFVPVLMAGTYTTWIKYGSSGWVEENPHGLKLEIQEDASIKLFVKDIEVTSWILNQDGELSWENEPGASRSGVPVSANIKFEYKNNIFTGYFRYPGEGKVDFKGQLEVPT